MDVIANILGPIGTVAQAIGGTYTVASLLTSYLRDWARTQKTVRVLAFMEQLGLVSETEVREAVKNWNAPKIFTPAQKEELTDLLINLVRGARFHSTNGTPLSSYLRCAHLIEQLLQNIQPKRRAGEKIQNWELKSFLGMGAFGEVWRAENLLYPTPHVFKFFTLEGSRDWLRREAMALMKVRQKLRECPYVIGYLDVAVDAEPHPYLVLEYADAGSLEDWILRRSDDRQPLNALDVMRDVARGTAEAHRYEIFHRDLKPANILLSGDRDPIPKVADFGLSRIDSRHETQSSMRSEPILVGTRMYHPPEASDPFRARHPAQDDVFALGVIWYQLLTGELVRPAYDFAEQLSAAGADSRTIKLISRCLAHPSRRFANAGELWTELDVETPPGPGEWTVPAGCFDVAGVAREYLEQRMW